MSGLSNTGVNGFSVKEVLGRTVRAQLVQVEKARSKPEVRENDEVKKLRLLGLTGALE